MIISNNLDDEAANALAEQLAMLPDAVDKNFTHREILMAYVIAIGSTLHSVSCADCREAANAFVQEMFPDIIRTAMRHAARHHSGQPPTGNHFH